MTTLYLRKSIRRSPWRCGYLFIAVALAALAHLQTARAVSPPPDGGYPGQNTAEGDFALNSLVSDQAIDNTAVGYQTLQSLTSGNLNTAVGFDALANDTADNNTATGAQALEGNTTGTNNTAVGENALNANMTGMNNTAVGENALSINTGTNNIALGRSAGSLLTGGMNNIDIGALGVGGESSVIRVGRTGVQHNTFIAGIFGQTVASTGMTVFADGTGKLGTMLSARRFKHDIKPMDKTSEAILALKPVTFHYNNDAKNTPCFGLIAEEVAEVNPNLIVRDNNGEILSVRYEQINAMLLNEFIKEHKKVEQLQATVAQ
jgi:hypothetical protein